MSTVRADTEYSLFPWMVAAIPGSDLYGSIEQYMLQSGTWRIHICRAIGLAAFLLFKQEHLT